MNTENNIKKKKFRILFVFLMPCFALLVLSSILRHHISFPAKLASRAYSSQSSLISHGKHSLMPNTQVIIGAAAVTVSGVNNTGTNISGGHSWELYAADGTTLLATGTGLPSTNNGVTVSPPTTGDQVHIAAATGAPTGTGLTLKFDTSGPYIATIDIVPSSSVLGVTASPTSVTVRQGEAAPITLTADAGNPGSVTVEGRTTTPSDPDASGNTFHFSEYVSGNIISPGSSVLWYIKPTVETPENAHYGDGLLLSDGTTSATLAVTVAVMLGIPGTPPAPTFGAVTPTSVVIFTPNLPLYAALFSVQRAPDVSGSPGTFAEIALKGANTSFTDTGLTASTKYWYRFAAVNSEQSTTGPYASDMTTAPDVTPPTFSSGSVNAAGNSIAWVYADPTSAGLLPAAPTGHLATADGAALTLGTASVSGMVVTTPITSGVVSSSQVILGSYAPGNLTDNAATPNAVAAFTNQPITNNSTHVAPVAISITAPASGTTETGIVPLTAHATGGLMGIAKVELYVNGSLVDTAAAPTSGHDYTLHWDTTPSGNGTYSLTAKAYDYSSPPLTATSAAISLTAANPDRLGTVYWYSEPVTERGVMKTVVATADLVKAADARSLRQVQFGIHVPGSSVNFDADYAPLPLNFDFDLPTPGTTFRLGARLSSRYSLGPITFTGQIVKIIAGGAGKAILWTADGKLWLFDGISVSALLLDTATLLQSGETLRDIAVSQNRVYLALAGGPAPLASRLYDFDMAVGGESYSVGTVFPDAVTALCSTALGLFIGTATGQVHLLSLTGGLKRLCGGTTATLPAGVSQLLPLPLTANGAPGVCAVLTDGSAWDITAANAAYGAAAFYTPATGQGMMAGAIADAKYLGAADGTLFAQASGTAMYSVAYAFPSAVNALAGYGGTVYAGLASDGRLWGKTLAPGAFSLAYGPVTDSMTGLTAITSLLSFGTSLIIGGTGSGNTLWVYAAPAASDSALQAQAFKHPGLTVREFA